MKDKILPIILVLVAVLVAANLIILDINWFKQQKESRVAKTEFNSETINTPISSTTSAVPDSCGNICQQTIEEKISQAMATVSGKETIKETKAVEKPSKETSQAKVVYIPLGGSGSTTSTSWADVGNAEVYFDLSDYPNLSEARFEGFIKVKNGNGKAFARLYDVTHSIGVQGSNIETTSENFTMVSSDPLAIWQGKNLYRIQVKSLNGYDAYLDSGRIKLTLK